MKWKICGSCVLAEPLTRRMGQAGSSLGGGLSLLWLVAFFLFVLNINEQLRWLGQKLLQTVGRGSMQDQVHTLVWASVPSASCAGHRWFVGPSLGLFPPILGTRGGKDTQTPTAWCCHIAALHSSSFSLKTHACGPLGNSILELVEPLSLELHIVCVNHVYIG